MSDEPGKLERHAYCFFKAGGAVTLTEWMSMSEEEQNAFAKARARADGVALGLTDEEAASALSTLAEMRTEA